MTNDGNDVTKWYTIYLTLTSLINQVSEIDYPTLYEKLESANGDVKALLIAAIG